MSHVADLDILADEEADRRRVVEEQELAQYVATVKRRQSEAEAARQEQERADTAEQQESARKQLADALDKNLRISVPLHRVRIDEVDSVGYFGEWYPVVEFGGVTFALRYMNGRNGGISYKVHIARPCVNCGGTVWSDVMYPADLVYEMEREHRHDHACRQQFDEGGEPITDRFGNPPEPRTPPVSAEAQHQSALNRYTAAVARRRHLEFQRPIEKAQAIKRLMDSQQAKSATAAKEMSHEDPAFAALCQDLTEAVIAEMEAREALLVARKNAGLSGAGASSGSDEEEAA